MTISPDKRLLATMLALALLACLLRPAAALPHAPAGARDAAVPKVPAGFVGVNIGGPVTDGQTNTAAAFSTMEATGVDSVRAAFSWAQAQPEANGPIDFTATDRVVGLAAERGLSVLPVVIYTPGWDAKPTRLSGTLQVPERDGPYADYLTALVGRYGPNGTFWSQNPQLPKIPIHEWQIWNEPNFTYYWPTRPFAPSYVALLHAAHAAIKHADPSAQVVVAGLPNDAWEYLERIYRVSGASHDFDVVAAHPYAVRPAEVILFLQKVRDVMKRNGDPNMPLLITETGWNAAVGRRPADNYCCQTTVAAQVAKVSELLPLLAENRVALGLQGFYYYTWATDAHDGAPSADFAGLFTLKHRRLMARPVYSAFRAGVLAMEHCRRIGQLAGRCAIPSG